MFLHNGIFVHDTCVGSNRELFSRDRQTSMFTKNELLHLLLYNYGIGNCMAMAKFGMHMFT